MRARSLDLNTTIDQAHVRRTRYWHLQLTGFQSESSARDCAQDVTHLPGVDAVWIFPNLNA